MGMRITLAETEILKKKYSVPVCIHAYDAHVHR